MLSKSKTHKKKVAREELIRDFNYHNTELEESGLYGLDDPADMNAGIEGMGDINFNNDYDAKPEENIVYDETHILYGESAIDEETKEKVEEEKAKKEPPYDPKKVIKHKIPNIGKSVKNYMRKKSGDNFRKVILDLVDMVPDTINYCVEYVMYHYCYFAFKDSQDWPAYEQTHANACATIMKMITVPIAVIIVGNWWYLLNYTDFYVDTDKIFESFPLDFFESILEPTKWIIATMNDWLMGRRVFGDTSNTERNFYKKLWDYRPITICIAFLFVASMTGTMKFNDVLRSAILGKPNTVFNSIVGISILVYFYLFVRKNFDRLYGKFHSIILVAIFFLVCLIGVILFSYLGVFIVFYYIIFFSFFFIFAYNFGNVFEVMKIGKQIHTDLIFSRPFFENTKGSVFKKIANELIRNSFVLLTQLAGVGIVFYGYVKSAAELTGKSQKAINMMRLFYGVFGLYGGYNVYSLIKKIWKDLSGTLQVSKEEAKNESSGNNSFFGNMGNMGQNLGQGASGSPLPTDAASIPVPSEDELKVIKDNIVKILPVPQNILEVVSPPLLGKINSYLTKISPETMKAVQDNYSKMDDKTKTDIMNAISKLSDKQINEYLQEHGKDINESVLNNFVSFENMIKKITAPLSNFFLKRAAPMVISKIPDIPSTPQIPISPNTNKNVKNFLSKIIKETDILSELLDKKNSGSSESSITSRFGPNMSNLTANLPTNMSNFTANLPTNLPTNMSNFTANLPTNLPTNMSGMSSFFKNSPPTS